VARIKILPTESDTNLDEIIKDLPSQIPSGMELKRYRKEPLAFGIYSLLCDFTLDDSEGQMDALEESIKKTNGVSEIQVISVSRQSVNIK
jgi:elongation factor 1-beta